MNRVSTIQKSQQYLLIEFFGKSVFLLNKNNFLYREIAIIARLAQTANFWYA